MSIILERNGKDNDKCMPTFTTLPIFDIFWPEMTHLIFYPVKNMYIDVCHRVKF